MTRSAKNRWNCCWAYFSRIDGLDALILWWFYSRSEVFHSRYYWAHFDNRLSIRIVFNLAWHFCEKIYAEIFSLIPIFLTNEEWSGSEIFMSGSELRSHKMVKVSSQTSKKWKSYSRISLKISRDMYCKNGWKRSSAYFERRHCSDIFILWCFYSQSEVFHSRYDWTHFDNRLSIGIVFNLAWHFYTKNLAWHFSNKFEFSHERYAVDWWNFHQSCTTRSK